MNKKLEDLIELLPMIRQICGRNVFLTLIDADRVLRGFALPEGEKPQLNIGEVFEDPSGALDEVLRTGRPKHNHLPKEVMGEAFEGELIPIQEGGEVVGCIICTYSVDVKRQMEEITTKFQESVGNINNSLQELVGGMENLFNMLTDMDALTTSVEGDVQNAVSVVNKINSNASRSNILALNASIEAARSGEAGKGFAVVASEMGKLANDSGSSAKEIKGTLSTIAEHLVSIIESIKDASTFTEEHRGNISGIQEVLGEMMELAGELEKNIKL